MCARRYVRSPSAAKAKKGDTTGAGSSGGAKTSKMPAATQTSSPAEAKGKKKSRAAAAAPSASAAPGPKRPKKGAVAAVPIKVGAARARGGDAAEAHGRRADGAERARGGASSSDSELSDSDWPIQVPKVRSAPVPYR